MSTIIIPVPGSLVTSSTTAAACDFDSDDTLGYATLTATSLSTTASSTSPSNAYAEEANRYVSSLSEQQIVEFIDELEQKEQTINEDNQSQKKLVR